MTSNLNSEFSQSFFTLNQNIMLGHSRGFGKSKIKSSVTQVQSIKSRIREAYAYEGRLDSRKNFQAGISGVESISGKFNVTLMLSGVRSSFGSYDTIEQALRVSNAVRKAHECDGYTADRIRRKLGVDKLVAQANA